MSSKRLIAEENQNVTIACTASGQPQPRVTWSKPFGSLPKDRAEMVNGTLKIYNVAKTDGGIYLCKAENVMGAEIATAQPPPQAFRFSHGRGERETSDW